MRIALATPLYPPDIGGPATYAKALVDGLPGRGIEVELVKFSDVRRLPKVIRHFAYFLRVRRALRRAELVLALDPVSVGLPACLAARRAGKPLIVKIVGDYAWEQGRQRFGVTAPLDEFVRAARAPFPVRLLRRVETLVARSARRIVVPSAYLKGVVAAWGAAAGGAGIPPEKIEVIYNAVPLEKIGTVPGAAAALARPLVVTAGRLVPWKGIDGVIDAVAAVPEAALAVVGDGPSRAALMRRAREKLSGRCAFTGALPHEDALAVLKSADVFVLNSSYEGLSHLLIEALALGVPTVATSVGGNPEVITDGGNGLLVPAGDASALSAAIARVLGDGAFRARLSARAAESAKRFSIEGMLSRTSGVLRELGHRMS